jgi:N-acetylmuramoyl-L-alanine amidase
MVNVPEYLIVHHTGGTQTNPLTDTSHHTYEIVDNYHKSLGWEGIGYHYFIEKDGTLKQGRAENYHGAHTKGYNEKSLGICLAGNFDQTLPTQEQINTLTVLLKQLSVKYKIPREKIFPHRKFANKTCYGRRLSDEWARDLIGGSIEKEKLYTLLDDMRKVVDML